MISITYFLFDDKFCAKPTDVPAISTKKLCPNEYNNKSKIPHRRLPSFATIASNTTKTGVARGEEKKPLKIPVKNAPPKPRLLLKVWEDGIKLNISYVWRAIRSISTPSNMYHQEPAPCMSFPRREAAVPRIVNVIAKPIENTTESQKAFFISCSLLPPTYPITSGILVSAHGVMEVNTPASTAKKGAIHIFEVITCPILQEHSCCGKCHKPRNKRNSTYDS